MKPNSIGRIVISLVTVLVTLQATSAADEYNLGKLALWKKLQPIKRKFIHAGKKHTKEVVLNAATGDGLVWMPDVDFSEGTIEVEVQGSNRPGRSFVGIAFHGKDNRTFDVVYLRPFNFQESTKTGKTHSIQYIFDAQP